MKPGAIPIPKHPLAEEAFRRWDELKQPRARFETDWEDMARLIRPQRGGFGMDSPTLRSLDKPLNSEPVIAHGHFAAGIYAGITNPATTWGGLATPDEDLNRWPPMAEWLDRTARRIHNSFSPSMSSFYSNSYQAYADLAVFGNAAAYDELDSGQRKFRDVTLSLGEVVVDIDDFGQVNEAVRRYHLTPRQAMRAFKGNVPAKIAELAEKGAQEKHAYVRHVLPNDDWRQGSIGPKGKAWLSVTACELERTLLSLGGYDEMPFYYPRWDVDGGFSYGTGPGFVALPSARKLHLMEDATLRASQRAADPTLLAPDRDAVPMNGTFRPGSTVYGAVTMNGTPLVRAEDFNGNIGLTLEDKRAAAEAVREAFYYSVMTLTGRTGISDDENRVIEEARLRNWAPHADRIMEEYAARKFERRFRLLWRAGQVDPVPEGIPQGTPLQVRYTSAAAMALRASEANAVRGFLADLGGLAQYRPDVLDRLSVDDAAEILHDASPSLPQRLLVPREQANAARQARAEAQEAQQTASLTREGGAAAADLARAGAALGLTGGS